MPSAATWMDLEMNILSGVSQRKTIKTSLTHEILKKKKSTHELITKQTNLQRKPMVTKEDEGGGGIN